MAIEAVVFDIGNVIARWDPRFLYEKLIPDPVALARFLSEVLTYEWHDQFDRGADFATGIRNLAAAHPADADLIRLYDVRWFETIPYEIPGTAALIERLAANGVPLFALTNFPAEKFPSFRDSYPVMGHFRDVVVSGIERIAKPDPAIYELTEIRTGIAPDNIFFIDDKSENIAAATARGWTGHLFRDSVALERELIPQGLL